MNFKETLQTRHKEIAKFVTTHEAKKRQKDLTKGLERLKNMRLNLLV